MKLSGLHKLLLAIEVTVVFSIPAVYLMVGLVLALVATKSIFSDFTFEPAVIVLYLIVIGGILGLMSIFFLLARALGDERAWPGPRITWLFIILGFLALAPFSYRAITDSTFWQLVWFLPYFVAAHLIVVNQHFLFVKIRKEVNSPF